MRGIPYPPPKKTKPKQLGTMSKQKKIWETFNIFFYFFKLFLFLFIFSMFFLAVTAHVTANVTTRVVSTHTRRSPAIPSA